MTPPPPPPPPPTIKKVGRKEIENQRNKRENKTGMSFHFHSDPSFPIPLYTLFTSSGA